MNRKIILTALFTCLVYGLIYFLSPYFIKEIKLKKFQNFVLYPVCESNDISLTILDSTETVCLSETRLYTRSHGKSEKLRDREKDTLYFPSTLNLLISQDVEQLKIEQIASTKEISTIQTLPFKFGTPIALFFTKDSTSQATIFLSIEIPANSPKDNKSKHYKIIISNTPEHKVTVAEFSTLEMLRVTNYDSKKDLALLRELYPFLEEKLRILVWKVKPVMLQETPIHDTFPELFVPLQEETPESSQLLGKYSTTIKKRVYNCFDFSESSQITLRSCKPEL